MTQIFQTPVWVLALLAAAGAPACVRLLSARIERRARRRTADLLALADEAPSPTVTEAAPR